MPDEAIKEAAATKERRLGTRLASGEFFYMVERIDRLDEKMTGEIKSLDAKLTGEIKSLDAKLTGEIRALDTKFNTLQQWMIGLLVAVIVGAGGIVVAILHH